MNGGLEVLHSLLLIYPKFTYKNTNILNDLVNVITALRIQKFFNECVSVPSIVLTQFHSRIDFSIVASLQVDISDTQHLIPIEI
eukprot:SAG11_NODE_8611_length_995_cov_2.279018_1_plen_84_part_00